MSEFCTLEEIKQVLLKYDKGYQGKDSEFLSGGSLCLPKFIKLGIVRDFEEAEDGQR